MLKRWANIMMCIWLINSVIWFQVPTSLALNANYTDESQENLVEMSSLFCSAAHFLFDDADEAPQGDSHKIKYRNHFLVNRVTIAATMVPSQMVAFCFENVPTTIKLYIGKYNTVSHFLPSYYSFLFRLSPF